MENENEHLNLSIGISKSMLDDGQEYLNLRKRLSELQDKLDEAMKISGTRSETIAHKDREIANLKRDYDMREHELKEEIANMHLMASDTDRHEAELAHLYDLMQDKDASIEALEKTLLKAEEDGKLVQERLGSLDRRYESDMVAKDGEIQALIMALEEQTEISQNYKSRLNDTLVARSSADTSLKRHEARVTEAQYKTESAFGEELLDRDREIEVLRGELAEARIMEDELKGSIALKEEEIRMLTLERASGIMTAPAGLMEEGGDEDVPRMYPRQASSEAFASVGELDEIIEDNKTLRAQLDAAVREIHELRGPTLSSAPEDMDKETYWGAMQREAYSMAQTISEADRRLEEKVKELTSQINARDTRIQALNDRVHKMLEEHTAEMVEKNNRIFQTDAKVEELNIKIGELNKTIQQLKDTIDEQHAKLKIRAPTNLELERMLTEKADMAESQAKAIIKLQYFQEHVAALTSEKSKLLNQVEALTVDLEESEKTKGDAIAGLQKMRSEIVSMTNGNKHLRKKLEALETSHANAPHATMKLKKLEEENKDLRKDCHKFQKIVSAKNEELAKTKLLVEQDMRVMSDKIEMKVQRLLSNTEKNLNEKLRQNTTATASLKQELKALRAPTDPMETTDWQAFVDQQFSAVRNNLKSFWTAEAGKRK